MSEQKDAELGALVRRMPENSELIHRCTGDWTYRPHSGMVDVCSTPEGALFSLRETFAERWLRHCENGELAQPGVRAELHHHAKRETAKPDSGG